MLVALDAGHGKDTAGKRSPDCTLLEYEFNRAIASRVRTILTAHGVSVILTAQPDDLDTSLSARCCAANKKKANIFVSLHANASGSGTWDSASGWEIYVYKKGGQAEKLAQSIHSVSLPCLGLKDRGIKEADFYVLRKTNMPAVLIEHGFYTNRGECALLKSTAFRDKCAEVDAKGILNYLGII